MALTRDVCIIMSLWHRLRRYLSSVNLGTLVLMYNNCMVGTDDEMHVTQLVSSQSDPVWRVFPPKGNAKNDLITALLSIPKRQ